MGPEITTRINSHHWLSFLEAYRYTHHICVCLRYCLTHVECFRFFIAANTDFV